jgi:hemerythrin-like domain-containing protein
MLRNKNLVPLSHQHQHALALCVRIDRASPMADADLDAWLSEVAESFRNEISIHFAAEERVLFPVAQKSPELAPLVEDLLLDHAWLRDRFAKAEARTLSPDELSEFARRLSAHIRKEERQLFERLQELLSEAELASAGRQLEAALKDATEFCSLPTAATRLKPSK